MLNNCWIIWIHLISGKFYNNYKQSFIDFSWIGIWFYKPAVNNCGIIWIYCVLLLVMLNNCWIIWIHLIFGKFYYIYKQSFIVFSWIGIWFYKPAIIRFTKNKYTQWIIVELYGQAIHNRIYKHFQFLCLESLDCQGTKSLLHLFC